MAAYRAVRNRLKPSSPEPSSKKAPVIDRYALQASVCRDDYFEFVKTFWPVVSAEKPVWNWHTRYLCYKAQQVLERVFRGEPKSYDAVFNVPPGSSKSTIFSVMLAPWAWTRMPHFRFIGGSYSGDIAQELSMRSRDVVRSDLYKRLFPGIKWRPDQDTKNYFTNTAGGWRFAVGVKGDVTGRHAHAIVVDDPLNPEESYSEAEIATANRWIRETLSSRKVNKAVAPMLLVMQRLHQNDPSADFPSGRKKVFRVCLPAELTKDVQPRKLRKRYKGGLLDPKRMPRSVLEEEQSRGDAYYAGQFLQNPIPRGGLMFDAAKVTVAPHAPSDLVQVVRSWDKAAVAGGRGAYTSGVKLASDSQGRTWILDVVRGRWNSYARERKMLLTARSDGREVRIVLEQEPGSGGKDSAEASVRNLRGFRVKVVKVSGVTGGKAERADPLSAQVNAGNVFLVKAPWNKEFIEEMRFFPASRYKDQVDAASLGFNELTGKRVRAGALRTEKERENKETTRGRTVAQFRRL